MNLSDGEKLIILMLTEVYEKLGIKGEFDPGFLQSAIFNNKTWGIRWKYPGIPFESAEDPEIVGEVMEILQMWAVVESSCSKLSPAEKVALEKEAHPLGKDPHFEGFDGNNETEYMGIAMFLVNNLDRFVQFKGRGFDCHFPSIDNHRCMLNAYRPLRGNLFKGSLGVQELTDILKARIHPSMRREPK